MKEKLLPEKTLLLTAGQMQQADHAASEKIGIPSPVLMERAALSMAQMAEEILGASNPKKPARIVIVCGKGNNGADGLALARLLYEKHYDVFPLLLDREGKEGSSFSMQLGILEKLGAHAEVYEKGKILALYPDLVVDAMFGVGLSRPLSGKAQDAALEIRQARGGGAFVLACDMPSGISADTGAFLGTPVCADATATFGFYKRGQFLYPGTGCCGTCRVFDVGIPKAALQSGPVLYTYQREDLPYLLPKRDPAGNKGTNGKVLLLSGQNCVAGAALLASRACETAGAGMVRVFTEQSNRTIVQSERPECLLTTYDEGDPEKAIRDLQSGMEWADVIAAGPGMGKGPLQVRMIREILSFAAAEHRKRKAFCLDADAIRIIAENGLYDKLSAAGAASEVLLTPHLAEAAALLGTSVTDLRADRIGMSRRFAGEHHVTLLVKDARSIVVSPGDDSVYLNTTGNAALSTAGSGDVLTGICAAFLAQGLCAKEAGITGSLVHGLCADLLVRETSARSVRAGDLSPALAKVLHKAEHTETYSL